MKVLICGGGGFIGGAMAIRLKAEAILCVWLTSRSMSFWT